MKFTLGFLAGTTVGTAGVLFGVAAIMGLFMGKELKKTGIITYDIDAQ